MATKHKCIQGDSMTFKITSSSVETFDANWTGTWAIVDAIPSANADLASGTLNISSDDTYMELRIIPADTNPIPVGKYYLIAEITNTTIYFNQEVIQDEFTIIPQGI